jgi:heme A synthase
MSNVAAEVACLRVDCTWCRERNKTMTGWIVLLIVVLVLIVLGLVAFLFLLPDIRRYLRIRSM